MLKCKAGGVAMSICIFPGTFNPIHDAHINIAKYALENFKFDKIIFIPAYIPPHKEVDSNMATHRFNMVKLAISEIPNFEISDIEYNLEGKSYSLITVKKIKELYNIEGRVNFIIGTDAFEKIKTWYKTEELAKLVHFVVFPRGCEINEKEFLDYDYEIVNLDFFDISSTEIRNNNNKHINKRVEDYIKQNDLYKI